MGVKESNEMSSNISDAHDTLAKMYFWKRRKRTWQE